MTAHPASLRALVRVYGVLLALLALTAATSRLPGGAWSLPLALAIATGKLALIFIFFMQLRVHRGVVRIVAAAGFFWLALLLGLAFTDYLTRRGLS